MTKQLNLPAADTGVSSVGSARWVVPPWAPGASLCAVVRHFLRFDPRPGIAAVDRLAYYRAYLAAIEAAPKHELTRPWGWQWYSELHDCVTRCVTAFEERQRVETCDVRQLDIVRPGTGPLAQPQAQAS